MAEGSGSSLNEAMDRLWTKFLPQMEQRVSTLREAAARVSAGNLSVEEQGHACAEAHKLAGVLGTFGLQEGTELAREAETLYGGTLEMNGSTASRLTVIAARLTEMIARRK